MKGINEDCTDLKEFISSIDTSYIKRLLTILTCPQEDFLETSKVLEKHEYNGYQVPEEFKGDPENDTNDQKWGWTVPVKRVEEDDSDWRLFIGVVDHPKKDYFQRWAERVIVVHEIGHAYDMDHDPTFKLDEETRVEDREYAAHEFACRNLREQGCMKTLTNYLSWCIVSAAKSDTGSHGGAARRFMKSNDFNDSLLAIPQGTRIIRNLPEPKL